MTLYNHLLKNISLLDVIIKLLTFTPHGFITVIATIIVFVTHQMCMDTSFVFAFKMAWWTVGSRFTLNSFRDLNLLKGWKHSTCQIKQDHNLYDNNLNTFDAVLDFVALISTVVLSITYPWYGNTSAIITTKLVHWANINWSERKKHNLRTWL